jgi:hypothetical protein
LVMDKGTGNLTAMPKILNFLNNLLKFNGSHL